MRMTKSLAAGVVLAGLVAGCDSGGGSGLPENNGQPFTPPAELDQMKQDMMKAFKEKRTGKAPPLKKDAPTSAPAPESK